MLLRQQLFQPLLVKLRRGLIMVNAKETDEKPTDHSTVEDVSLKRDKAAIAAAEEHGLSLKDALLNNKRILWWCLLFAMSAIGW